MPRIQYVGTDDIQASDAAKIRNHGEMLGVTHSDEFMTEALHEYNERVYRVVETMEDGERTVKAMRL